MDMPIPLALSRAKMAAKNASAVKITDTNAPKLIIINACVVSVNNKRGKATAIK